MTEKKKGRGRPRKIREPDAMPTNGYDPKLIASLVDKIEGHKADKLSAHGRYMKECGEIKIEIDAVYDEAKARGVPKKVLQVYIKERELDSRKETLANNLDADQQQQLRLIKFAMGDLAETELGQAALTREATARGMKGGDAPGTYA